MYGHLIHLQRPAQDLAQSKVLDAERHIQNLTGHLLAASTDQKFENFQQLEASGIVGFDQTWSCMELAASFLAVIIHYLYIFTFFKKSEFY